MSDAVRQRCGRRVFVDGDGNSAWYRRRQDILESHLDDLGGRAFLSESQISLASRAASIEVELEQMEGRLSKGETVDLDAFTRAASHLRRILETLGVPRAQRDVTPVTLDAVAGAPQSDERLAQLSTAELDRYIALKAEEGGGAELDRLLATLAEAREGRGAYPAPEAGEESAPMGEMAASEASDGPGEGKPQ